MTSPEAQLAELLDEGAAGVYFARGMHDGRQWRIELAQTSQIERLRAFVPEHHLTPDTHGHTLGERLAMAAIGVAAADQAAIGAFWRPFIRDEFDDCLGNYSYVCGFIDGVFLEPDPG